jgi:predicted DNA-binding transcriptional regulator AlpA
MIDQEKLLDKKTVMERFHFSRSTLNWLIRTRQIPGLVRVGKGKGQFFFDPEELDSWIKQNKINA